MALHNDPEMAQGDLIDLINQLENSLAPLKGQNAWIYDAFAARLPFWRQVAAEWSGVKDEVEKPFSVRIKNETQWNFDLPTPPKKRVFVSTDDAKKKEGNAAEEAAPAVPEKTIDISMEALQKAAKKYESIERPMPKCPMEFFMGNKIKDYLEYDVPPKELPGERQRINQLIVLRSHLYNARGVAVESMTWKKGKKYGAGNVLFSMTGIRFQPNDKKEKAINLKWEDCPYEQMMTFLTIYAERLTQTISKARAGKQKDMQSKLAANAWMKAAYLASWYNKLDEVREKLQKALAVSQDPELMEQIEKYFLN